MISKDNIESTDIAYLSRAYESLEGTQGSFGSVSLSVWQGLELAITLKVTESG